MGITETLRRHVRWVLKALKSITEGNKGEERTKEYLKFSRKFRGLVRVKSDFKGTKVSNSLENLRERCQVTTEKDKGSDGFS